MDYDISLKNKSSQDVEQLMLWMSQNNDSQLLNFVSNLTLGVGKIH